MVNYGDFVEHCFRLEQPRQSESYINTQSHRLYRTYQLAEGLISDGDTLLSVGAGAAYMETLLAEEYNIDVVVADLPDAIEAHQDLYKKYEFDAVGCDISEENPLPSDIEADLIMSCEVLEHLDRSPQAHLSVLSRCLSDQGHILVTTPNLASLRVISILLLNKSYLPDANSFFSEIGFENEWVHRREYVKQELVDGATEAGLRVRDTGYMFKRKSREKKLWVLYPFEKLIPRFRPIQYIIAQSK